MICGGCGNETPVDKMQWLRAQQMCADCVRYWRKLYSSASDVCARDCGDPNCDHCNSRAEYIADARAEGRR